MSPAIQTTSARRRVRALLGGASLVAVAATGCKNPTEITLDVRTDIACTGGAPWKGVAIYVGHPGDDVESKAATLVTTQCDGTGEIGTLVIKPSGADDDVVGIRVVAGITRNPEDCSDAGYQGCVVERRALRFSPSTPLTLVVDLPRVCTGVGCDSGQTCVDGACVDNFTASNPPTTGPTNDAGVTTGPVHCGDNGVTCPTAGDVCCLAVDVDAGTATGACLPATACPTANIVMRCDRNSECADQADDAGTFVCCAIVNFASKPIVRNTECLSRSICKAGGSEEAMMCQDRDSCDGLPCETSDVPGYFECYLR